ncbi:hypothetical protein AURDEDRAFT_182590 [Auricularia subglabra TFB-10046 SS5]|nr:hypothetical protein AURDEDRAFT_182590 [Auricularia subglabra TFB-10046 SS5]
MGVYITRKRICCFCDGTGQDALIATDDGNKYGDGDPLYFTNVLRLSRAVKCTTPDPKGEGSILQVTYYQSGVGTDTDFKGHASKAEYALELFGTAVARKIRDCYAFISQNYEDGDEIFLFGFSRGAYTARKIAGLIDRLGLLDIKDMGKFYAYCYALETGKGQMPPPAQRVVPIQVLGVWDTVGALRTSLLQSFPGAVDQLSISDALLPANVKVALHALAVHENRNWFQPTLFKLPPEDKMSPKEKEQRKGQVLKEVWFGGEHSDVGGGWATHELADIALIWMAGEVLPYLALDEEQLLDAIRPNPAKPAWGESIPHNSWENTPTAVALVGGIDASTRLNGGHFKPDSLFHPSFLRSPRPTMHDVEEHDKEDSDSDGNIKEAGKAKKEIKVNIVKAMGKHMITLDDLIKKFGPKWQPKLVTMNPIEEKAKEIWHTLRKADGHAATYESAEQAKDLLRGKTKEASAAGKD